MSSGGIDMSQVRAKGIPAHGLGPIRSLEELGSGNPAHSDNEHVDEKVMIDFVRFMWLAIIGIAASR